MTRHIFENGNRVCWADRSQGAPKDVAATVTRVLDWQVIQIRWDHEKNAMFVFAKDVKLLDAVTRLADLVQ